MEPKKFNIITTHPLQSWEWGEFRKAWGNKVVRLSNFQIIFSKIPFTPFTIGTVIRGPKITKKDIEEVKEISKRQNAIFVKFEPNILYSEKLENENKSFGLIKGRRLFTPTSFWIDLTKSEEELLKSFHPKTRYNIRLAQKQGVEVIEDNSDKAFEKYLALTKETSKRQGFYSHTERYHRLMWKYLKPPGITHLLVAKYRREIISAWILFAWKGFLYYPYGASTDKYKQSLAGSAGKNVMANNLMMWEAVCLGRRLGLKTFDLWGREEGKGFTKFKEGYNPKIVSFIGTWDLPTSIFYWPYRIAESLRWKILRLLK